MSRPSGPKSITAEQMVSGGELLQWSDTAVSKPAHAASTSFCLSLPLPTLSFVRRFSTGNLDFHMAHFSSLSIHI